MLYNIMQYISTINMSNGNINKCRVCLSDGAKYSIFENIESKDSVYSKLYQCLQEKIEDKEGYPRSICESCNNILNTTINFITKYRTSDKLLQSNVIVVKKEVICDSDDEVIKEDFEELCKDEPESDWIESFDDSFDESICVQIPAVEKQETSLTVIKAKLKGLKEINFKRKVTRKNNKKTSKVASSILEAEFAWNGERPKSSLMKESREEKRKEPQKRTKPELPEPPKQNETCLCDICGEIFNHKDNLSKHRKLQHINVTCECPKCHKVLKTNYYLKRHMGRIHGNKSLECDKCGKKYAYIGQLNTHIKQTHLKLRPKSTKKFGCAICDRRFVTRKSLLIHNRSSHTGERPSVCSECGARFYHDDYLKEHMRLHTGETPFACPICKRGYAQEGNMRSHMKFNHRLSDLSPEEIKNLKPGYLKCLKK